MDNRWIDFTRRNDPACQQGLDRLQAQLKKYGYPGVLCFWSKNPQGIALLYNEIIKEMQANGTVVLAQFTINNYGLKLEPGISSGMLDLSGIIELLGPDKIRLRFDPIIPGTTNISHFRATIEIAQNFGIKRIIANFIMPEYKGVGKLMASEGITIAHITDPQKQAILCRMLSMLKDIGIELAVCAETAALANYGLKSASCADPQWARQFGVEVVGRPSRKGCGCCYSDDWGQYRSRGGWVCPHGCLYCYAK